MDLKFTESILESCFPFYLCIDESWRLEAMGPSLERTMGSQAMGEKLDSLFDLSKPPTDSLKSFHETHSKSLIFLTDKSKNLKYRGQLFLSADFKKLFFLQTPIISELSALENKDLLFTDFAMTDPILDYLIMVQSHKELLEKSQRLNTKLERSINIAKSTSEKYLALLKVVMHDLSNPLAAIKMGVDRLVRKANPVDRVLSRLQSSTNAMLEIIDLTRESMFRTDDLSNNENIKLRNEAINIESIINESVDIFSQQISSKGLKINTNYSSSDPTVVSDRRILIYQVFNNILSNAIKFSYEKNDIDISITDSKDSLSINFKDHGCGIRKDDFEKVMSKNFLFSSQGTKGETGTGIGLKNVYYFSELLNANVDIESSHHSLNSENSGTSITVTLPLNADSKAVTRLN